MDYKIKKRKDRLFINAAVRSEEQQQLVEELAKCAAGKCTCPSAQYEKLEKIDVTSGQDGVSIVLKAKAGETIDRDDIKRCLEHTAKLIKPE